MEHTYVVMRLMQNGQSVIEFTTDDIQLANRWINERTNAVDGIVTNYQILTIPFVMPEPVVTGSTPTYVDTRGM